MIGIEPYFVNIIGVSLLVLSSLFVCFESLVLAIMNLFLAAQVFSEVLHFIWLYSQYSAREMIFSFESMPRNVSYPPPSHSELPSRPRFLFEVGEAYFMFRQVFCWFPVRKAGEPFWVHYFLWLSFQGPFSYHWWFSHRNDSLKQLKLRACSWSLIKYLWTVFSKLHFIGSNSSRRH